MMWYACRRQKGLAIFSRHAAANSTGHRSFRPTGRVLRNALKVSAPMTLEHAVICGAQIMVTVIVAPARRGGR